MKQSLLIVLLTASFPLQAAFEYRSGEPLMDAAEPCTLPGLVQFGPGSATRTMSFGRGVPIATAARMIAPDGWRVTTKRHSKAKLTWRAGMLWTNTLAAALTDVGACATLDWTNKRIHLYALKGKTQPVEASTARQDIPANKAAPLPGAGTTQLDRQADLKNAEIGNETAASTVVLSEESTRTSSDTPLTKRWQAVSGTTVRQTLATWAKAANWQNPIWDLHDDALITADASFAGTFEEAVTALIHNVVLGGTPLAVKLYRENKVIHVTGGS